jgi:cobalt-zinc-cadmium efflux system outer membrane protein
VARAGVARAELSVADVARVMVADVDRSFYGAVAAERRSELADQVLALNERLAQVATRQLAAGEISKLDYNLSVVELGRSRARALAARREEQENLIELHRLLGLPAGMPVATVFDSAAHHHVQIDSSGSVQQLQLSDVGMSGDIALDDLVARALERRPDLAERGAAVRQAQADVTLARREALPNLVARVQSEQNAAGTGRGLRPGIGVSLPLFNRNQGEVEARRAAARGAELDRVAVAVRVRAEVTAAFRAYQAAAGEVEILERTVLGPARDNLRLLETAYREGKIGLPVLLLVRNQVIDAEQDYWSAWLAERDAESRLRAAVGLSLTNSR